MDPIQCDNNCIITCPFFYAQGCKTRCSLSDIVDHFICSHKSSYKPHPITGELYKGTVYQYLTVAFNTVFYVQIEVTQQQNVEILVKYPYEHENDTLKFYQHHFVGTIKSFDNPYQMETFEFNIQWSKSHKNTQTVSCTIEISKKTTNELAVHEPEYAFLNLKEEFETDDNGMPEALCNESLEDSEPEVTTTEAFLEELVCSICANYLTAPIFNCSIGHSVCKDCKDKSKVCQTCKTKVTNGRSYVLEKLIERLQYPCKYADFGCQQTLQWKNVSEHIDACSYKTLKCPFKKCGMNIKSLALTDHFEREHMAQYFKDHQVLTKLISSSSMSYNSTIFQNEVFLLRFQYECETNMVKFGCMHITTGDVKNKKYGFELRFVSDIDSRQKLSFSNICTTQFTDFENAPVLIPVKLVKEFISSKSESTLHFKLFLKKRVA